MSLEIFNWTRTSFVAKLIEAKLWLMRNPGGTVVIYRMGDPGRKDEFAMMTGHGQVLLRPKMDKTVCEVEIDV